MTTNPTINRKELEELTDGEIQALAKAIGADWNSVYGHWELRLSDRKPMTILDPNEMIGLLKRVGQYADSYAEGYQKAHDGYRKLRLIQLEQKMEKVEAFASLIQELTDANQEPQL